MKSPARRACLALAGWLALAAAACAPAGPVGGLTDLPQETAVYLDRPELTAPALSPEQQKQHLAVFLERFLAPWGPEPPLPTQEEAARDFARLRSDPGYGENLKPHPPSWAEKLLLKADLDGYPNAGFKALTVTGTDMRALPTVHPVFNGLGRAGEGYPFDRLQESRLAPNTPVWVAHLSRDGLWALTLSHHGLGWVAVRDLARIDEAQAAPWQAGRLAAVIAEGTPVRDQDGRTLFLAGLGTVLPLKGQEFNQVQVWAAVADQDGRAHLKEVSLTRDQAVAMPAPFSSQAVARLADQLPGQPYGWGSYLGNRDCSALIKDLFTPFGLWLPRNSADQARQGGQFISLAGLSVSAKETLLKEQGLPFLTLVWMPGHIMLYIGQWEGRPAVLHSVWAVGGRDEAGGGRTLLGVAAITRLQTAGVGAEPGQTGGGLLGRAEGLILLTAPPGPGR